MVVARTAGCFCCSVGNDSGRLWPVASVAAAFSLSACEDTSIHSSPDRLMIPSSSRRGPGCGSWHPIDPAGSC